MSDGYDAAVEIRESIVELEKTLRSMATVTGHALERIATAIEVISKEVEEIDRELQSINTAIRQRR